ncbi:MAG TPA: carboxypeptidase-like regulatory domain-containing protein, partial [Anseongella sp.]|nr:carboxypeptidase-like regulatory domain-containing protein [Anseongella sp.]
MKYTISAALLLLICLTGTGLKAQITQATIVGTITDGQKKPLPGVVVQVRNESTGFTATSETGTSGEYIFKQLPLGKPYTVKVSFLGFGDQTKTGYALNQGDQVRVNFEMKEAIEMMKEIVVTASGLKSSLENFGAATSVTGRDIEQLPVNGRNFTSLIDLSPLSRGNNIAGQLGSSTNFTVDGMTARNPTSGGTANRRGGS